MKFVPLQIGKITVHVNLSKIAFIEESAEHGVSIYYTALQSGVDGKLTLDRQQAAALLTEIRNNIE